MGRDTPSQRLGGNRVANKITYKNERRRDEAMLLMINTGIGRLDKEVWDGWTPPGWMSHNSPEMNEVADSRKFRVVRVDSIEPSSFSTMLCES